MEHYKGSYVNALMTLYPNIGLKRESFVGFIGKISCVLFVVVSLVYLLQAEDINKHKNRESFLTILLNPTILIL